MKLLALLFTGILVAEPFSFTITESPYFLTTYFEMEGSGGYEGRVVKNFLKLRTVYDLFDGMGIYEGQGLCHLLSLGVIFPWGKEIDVFDEKGSKIGYIEGSLLTLTTAKYNFYNENHALIGSAFLDAEASGFTVMDPNEKTLARLKRNFIIDDIDSWKVNLYDEEEILDPRILKIFAAFAIDFQDSFKEDN